MLLPRAVATPYQNYSWIEAWCATEGARRRIDVAVAVATDPHGRPVAVLPLGTINKGPLRFATFLGGRQSNGNMGLFDAGMTWRQEDVRALLNAVAEQAQVDAFVLRNQPLIWFGASNPMATLPCQPSPSASHAAHLGEDGDATMLLLTSHARKRLRQKRDKLAAIGTIRHEVARTPEEIEAILDAYDRHKAGRGDTTAARGAADRVSWRAFLLAAADPTQPGQAPIELHALLCGPDIVATFGAALDQAGHVSGMFVSFDPRPDIARHSPGDQLIAAVMGRMADRGFTSFDLGIGEARYKASFCPAEVALVDSYIGVTALGRIASTTMSQAVVAKRRIKQSPHLWPLIQRARRFWTRARP